MAAIEPRLNDDGTTTYWVRWRQPGQTKKTNEQFTGPDAQLRAERFAIDVKLAGGRWPKLWWPRVGYITQEQWDHLTAPGPAEPARARVSLLPYLRERIALLTKVTPGTRAGYYHLIANYFDPHEPFATADVADPETLNGDMISAWVNWLADGEPHPKIEGAWLRTPKAPKTIHNAHGLAYQLLDYATRGERPLRRTNPCAHTDLPSLDDATDEEMVFLSHEEYAILHAAGGPVGQDVSQFAVGTGTRFGEYTAFYVGDVRRDRQPAALHVERAWKRDAASKEPPNPGFVLGPPKSTAGRRWATLDEETLAVLEDGYLDRAPSHWLFADTAGRPWTHARFYRGHWQPMVYRAVRCEEHRALDKEEGRVIKGVQARMTSKRLLSAEWMVPCRCPGTLMQVPRIHDLRHTWVSWLIAAKVPIPKIAKAAGHDDIKTTYKVYGHLMAELDREQAAAIGVALRGLRRAA